VTSALKEILIEVVSVSILTRDQRWGVVYAAAVSMVMSRWLPNLIARWRILAVN